MSKKFVLNMVCAALFMVAAGGSASAIATAHAEAPTSAILIQTYAVIPRAVQNRFLSVYKELNFPPLIAAYVTNATYCGPL